MSGNSTQKPDQRQVAARGAVAQRIDNSLRGHSLRRAMEEELPKTLTPWEWQQWYELNGMPRQFQTAREKDVPAAKSLWQRLLGR